MIERHQSQVCEPKLRLGVVASSQVYSPNSPGDAVRSGRHIMHPAYCQMAGVSLAWLDQGQIQSLAHSSSFVSEGSSACAQQHWQSAFQGGERAAWRHRGLAVVGLFKASTPCQVPREVGPAIHFIEEAMEEKEGHEDGPRPAVRV